MLKPEDEIKSLKNWRKKINEIQQKTNGNQRYADGQDNENK